MGRTPGSFFVLAVVQAALNSHRPLNVENYYGMGANIHAFSGKLPAPKRGWTLPGWNYTGPYNPLDKQLNYDPETGKRKENPSVPQRRQWPCNTTLIMPIDYTLAWNVINLKVKLGLGH